MLALVGDGESFTRVLLGLPDARHFQAHARPDGFELPARQPGVQPIEEVLRDALLLAQDGAPGGLGRMRRKARLDADGADERKRLLERVSLLFQARDGFRDASGLGGAGVGEVLAAAAHAVHLLGGVDRLEPRGEGTREIGRGQGLAAGCPSLERSRCARCSADLAPLQSGKPVALDRLEQLIAPLVARYLADEIAESVHVLAQARVLRGKLNGVALHYVGRTGPPAG